MPRNTSIIFDNIPKIWHIVNNDRGTHDRDRIKRKRQALGLSLQDLADRLEGLGIRLSRAALSNYENNKATPNAKTLWGIAKPSKPPWTTS